MFFSLGFFSSNSAQAFSPQVIQRGAVGDDVIELQARLQYIGYYRGKIDGVYGWETYWAVRNFQHDFGLDIDGLVGDEIKKKLTAVSEFDKDYVYGKLAQGENPVHYGPHKGPEGQPPPGQRDPGNLDRKWVPPGTHGAPQNQQQQTRQQRQGGQAPSPTPAPPQQKRAERQVGQLQQAVNIPQGFSDNDIRLMANAVYGESRGEPYEGQVAIAAVILNRIKSPEFPNTVSGVIFEPLAFSAVSDGQIWLEPDETAKRAVLDAINGWDPTGGKVYYFNPAKAYAPWMWERYGKQRGQAVQIGKHIFIN
jgi:N-acetylmuramoyl-L-alanine amidase